MRKAAIIGVMAAMAVTAAARGTGFGLFQHGGRATGQAGAFTARASDPSALFYNPAAITRLRGFQLEAGLDLAAPRDDYHSASAGKNAADHQIVFPPSIYMTWGGDGTSSNFAFGIGLDSPIYERADWDTAFFPGRFLSRTTEIKAFEVHPVLAYAPDERWSWGFGFRYLSGEAEQGRNALVAGGRTPEEFQVEAVQLAQADVDGYGFDLAVHYLTADWGWGAVARSGVELEGDADVEAFTPDPFPDVLAPTVAVNLARLRSGPDRLSFELPPEVRTGFWFAPYPELRIEADLALYLWSQAESSFAFSPAGLAAEAPVTFRRDWDDALSLRLGLEGDLSEGWTMAGGLGWEQSPIGSAVDPGFVRGDAWVYAIGFGYNFPQLSLDLGYSFHDHEDVGATDQELRRPGRNGRYETKAQVFAASARWRF